MLKKGNKRKQKTSSIDQKSIVRISLSVFLAFLAWGGAIAFESYVLSDKDVTVAVVAKQDVKAGTYIDDSNRDKYFMTESIEKKLVSDKTITNLKALGGKAVTDISTGEPVTTSRFIDTESAVDKLNDPYLVSFGVEDASKAANGYIRKGDIVNIVSSGKSDEGSESKYVLKDAYIVKSYDESYQEIKDNDTETKAVYFDVYIENANVGQFTADLTSDNITVVKKVLTEN